MQVRKFEAKSMKDALEMVKNQLGPEAIILSAKDNSKGFGLAGRASYEITAAVSEETLYKKKFVESRLREEDKKRIQNSPAKVQKQFIENMVGKYRAENAPKAEITRTPYIDIEDEEAIELEPQETAGERVRSAAQRAWNAMNASGNFTSEFMTKDSPPKISVDKEASNNGTGNNGAQNRNSTAKNTTSKDVANRDQVSTTQGTKEIQTLREELAQLKSVLNQFQQIPQTIMSAGQHPGSEYGLSYEFSPMFEKLIQAGITQDLAAEILTEAQKQMPPIKYKNRALIDGWVAKHILETTKVVDDNVGTKIQIFMGPAGSGKTSSLVKLASHYVVNAHKKVALVTTDTLKVGSADQLRIYAQILNVPFAIIRSSQDWDYVLKQLSGYDYILCDCPGVGLKSIEEIHFLKNVIPKNMDQTTIHLVLSATNKDQDLNEMGRRYKSISFQDVIFTGLDDSTLHGSLYNFSRKFEVPLHSFGIGNRVPEDFEMATRERVLDLIFKLTKVKKAVES